MAADEQGRELRLGRRVRAWRVRAVDALDAQLERRIRALLDRRDVGGIPPLGVARQRAHRHARRRRHSAPLSATPPPLGGNHGNTARCSLTVLPWLRYQYVPPMIAAMPAPPTAQPMSVS